MNSNQPGRIPPGTHPNWCRCQGCRNDIARFEARQFNGTVAIAGVVVAVGMIIWLGKALVHAWHGRLAIGLAAAVLAGVAVLLVRSFAWLREDDPPPGAPPPLPRKREAAPVPSSLPPPPPSVCVQPPPCRHLNAVKVDSVLDRTVVWCCWCPDCETELPAGFRRPCCATEPEASHLYNCPRR